MYNIVFSKQARKDVLSLTDKQKTKLKRIIDNIIMVSPNEWKKLVWDLKWYFSIRLNIKDRIVYRVNEKEKNIYILMCRSHYKN